MSVTRIPAFQITKQQEFTTGATTWTAPAGVYAIDCLLVAGGGGGGGVSTANCSGGGGGGGQVIKKTLTVVPGTSYTVTIGGGGAGGVGASAGANGTNSSFGSL
ncbi:hypothetical protein UFOVP802_1, partial [uncultured Caudovirales phage]